MYTLRACQKTTIFHQIHNRTLQLLRCCSRHAITDQDVNLVLKQLNTCSAEELLQRSSLGKLRSTLLLQHRENFGLFYSVDDLLKVKGLGIKTVKKVCSELLGRKEEPQTLQLPGKPTSTTTDRSLIYPRLSVDQLPPSVVSCAIQLDGVSWLQLTSDLEVTEWQYRPHSNYIRKRYDHAVYQEKIWETVNKMPKSDIYLMEESPLLFTTLTTVPTALAKARTEAILTTLLTHRTPQSATFGHRVHKLKHVAVSDYFGLLVGGERVSSQKVVRQILRGVCEKASRVSLSSEMYQNYFESKAVVKEQMSYCLLQAIMFYKEVVKHIPHPETEQEQ